MRMVPQIRADELKFTRLPSTSASASTSTRLGPKNGFDRLTGLSINRTPKVDRLPQVYYDFDHLSVRISELSGAGSFI